MGQVSDHAREAGAALRGESVGLGGGRAGPGHAGSVGCHSGPSSVAKGPIHSCRRRQHGGGSA
eukprot:14756824-Alexandrium_andersonii.AAC.1